MSRILGFGLAPFQEEFVAEADRLHPDGRRVFKRSFLLVPRGAGKTQLAAARAFYELLRREDQIEILLVAGDKEQAGHGLRYAKRWIRGSVELAGAVDVTADELRVKETSSVMKVMAARASAYGGTPDVLVADELHVDALRTRGALGSALDGDGEEAELVHARDQHGPVEAGLAARREPGDGVGEGDGRAPARLLDDFEGRARRDDDRLLRRTGRGRPRRRGRVAPLQPRPLDLDRQLRQARLAPGVSDEALALQHLNRPSVEPADALITRETLDRCRDVSLDVPEGAPIAVGVERAFGGGSAAVAWLWQAPDNRVVVRVRVLATSRSRPRRMSAPRAGDG